MRYEKTLVILKPLVLAKGIAGTLINRFENKGLDICALKMVKPNKTLYKALYQEHKNKNFYDQLVEFMMSDSVVVLVLGGLQAIAVCRTLVGHTNPVEAAPGTIRGDFGLDLTKNIVHASDSSKSASREIKIFFTAREIR